MLIEGNGIQIDANVRDGHLTYRVIQQTDEITAALRDAGVIIDDATGFSIRTNNYPSYNHNIRRFFIRGSDANNNDKTVTAKFASTAEAREAMNALARLIQNIREGEEGEPTSGGTSACRMAIITRKQANILCLTGHKLWKKERGYKPSKPIFINNPHFDEHVGQIVDVLNKAHGKGKDEPDTCNPHKVTREDARKAYELICRYFDEAEAAGPGTLVAAWRIVSGLRAPDVTDEDLAILQKHGKTKGSVAEED